MSVQVFPTIQGLAFPIRRSPSWNTRVFQAVSGREYRSARRTSPQRVFEMGFDLLKGPTLGTDLTALEGFFNARQGRYDSFLIAMDEDSSVTGQAIGTGDGVTTTFQLQRTFGAGTENVLAPNVVSHVYDNGVDGAGWTVAAWGTTTPGLVTYGVAPLAGHAITADFSFYFPVRFEDDSMTLERFMNLLWNAQQIRLRQLL